eukprot:6213735-Pleurochrysis_carterae.AAC.2
MRVPPSPPPSPPTDDGASPPTEDLAAVVYEEVTVRSSIVVGEGGGNASGIALVLEVGGPRHPERVEGGSDGAAGVPAEEAAVGARCGGRCSVSSSKRSRSSLGITIDLRSALGEMKMEAKKLRSDLMTAWKSNSLLTEEQNRLASDMRSAARRVDRSEAASSRALDWQREVDAAAKAQAQRNSAMAAYRAAMDKLEEERRLRHKAEEEGKRLQADLTKANVQLRAADALLSRYEHAKAGIAKAGQLQTITTAKLKSANAQLTKLQSELDNAKVMYETATKQLAEQVAEHESAVAKYKRELAALQRRLDKAEHQAAELQSVCADAVGRPRGHAGATDIQQRWDVMSAAARRTALCRHGSDIKDALLDSGCQDWLPSCLALALKSLGLMDDLLRTKLVAEWRFQFAEELANLLKADLNIIVALCAQRAESLRC